MKLDQKDIQLLKLLQNNARLSNKELAIELDMAPSTCHERLKKLTKSNFFNAFNASLNLEKLGFNIEVLITVRLKKHEREVVNSFIQKLNSLKGIIRFYHLAGETNFMLHVAVENPNSLRSFILDKLSDFKYIDNIESSIIYYNKCLHNLSYPSVAE